MGGEKADMVFTSPPYSDMRDYKGGADFSVNNIINFISASSNHADYQVVNLGIQRKNNEVYQYWDEYIQKYREHGYKFLSWNVWSKRGMGGSIANMSAMFRLEHEWIFVFGKFPKELNKTQENKSAGLHTGISNRQKDGTTKRADPKIVNEYGRMSSVLELCYGTSKEHPAVFPLGLPTEYINAMTGQGQYVLEPFLGSGTTLIACENTSRKCRGIEISPEYCAVILQRYQDATGKEPVRING
jgi:DNA modification methylase